MDIKIFIGMENGIGDCEMKDKVEIITDAFEGKETWRLGDGEIDVVTKSGTTYRIHRTGQITGGRFKNGLTAKLLGAVLYVSGPIKMNHVVVGLSIEGRTEDKHSKIFCSSPIVEIKR